MALVSPPYRFVPRRTPLSEACSIRPVSDAGKRVTPSELVLYWALGFRRPCCLCAVPKLDGSSPGYSESVVVMVVNGDRFGEYVFACATARCGYQGKWALRIWNVPPLTCAF